MINLPENLCVAPTTTIRQTIEAITKNSCQVALVTDPDGRLLGIVTDGDIRKALLRGAALDSPVSDSMNASPIVRSEEHTSELQSQSNLVCRLLLEKKKKTQTLSPSYRSPYPHATFTLTIHSP